MPYKADEAGPDRLLLEASEKAERTKQRHAAAKRMLLTTVCCECGAFGAYGDGQFLYCGEHAPDSLVNAAAHFKRRQEAARD